MEIRKIDSTDTYPIRQIVLRPGKSIETCYFEGDHSADTSHFGSFEKNALVGIISLFKSNNNSFNSENQMQIRGMAVLEEFQNKGLGALLIKQAEKIAIENNFSLIWFNAREKAIPFYEKMQYQIIGKIFEIENIGSHVVMFKKI